MVEVDGCVVVLEEDGCIVVEVGGCVVVLEEDGCIVVEVDGCIVVVGGIVDGWRVVEVSVVGFSVVLV